MDKKRIAEILSEKEKLSK